MNLYHTLGEDEFSNYDVHPEVAPGFGGYKNFLAESGFAFERSEFEVISERWHFCGHPDLLGRLNGGLMLIDLKYMDTVHLWPATYQLTLYKLAFEEQEWENPPIQACYVLQLKHDGAYRLHMVPTGPAEQQVAQAAVIVHRAIEEGRR